uniref:RlpA-like protein double-psi beta-barrel domain-containing protein n=1 Tax=Panagrolaimus davidi TaxID=227884 RepID=A0A914Q7E2_9BILA
MKDPLCNYCLEIDYNDKIITVPIKDRCPFCPRDQVYLSYKAFTSLQNPTDVGTVYGATFIIVPCDE